MLIADRAEVLVDSVMLELTSEMLAIITRLDVCACVVGCCFLPFPSDVTCCFPSFLFVSFSLSSSTLFPDMWDVLNWVGGEIFGGVGLWRGLPGAKQSDSICPSLSQFWHVYAGELIPPCPGN